MADRNPTDRIRVAAAALLDPGGYATHAAARRPWPDGVPPEAPAFAWDRVFRAPCPRFDRLDPLCRWVLAGAELLGLDAASWTDDARRGASVCLATASGSWRTDLDYLRGLDQPGGTSPTLFAYTLPSTAAGELCIRHGFRGPPLCFSCPPAGPEPVLPEAYDLLRSGRARACVCLAADSSGPAGESRACCAAVFLKAGPDSHGPDLGAGIPPRPQAGEDLRSLASSLVKRG